MTLQQWLLAVGLAISFGIVADLAMTFRMWSQVDRWQWHNIECRQVRDIVIP